MGHLFKALIVSGFFILAACSEAQFSSLEDSSVFGKSGESEEGVGAGGEEGSGENGGESANNSNNNSGNAGEMPPSPPLSEIPTEELPQYLSDYRCSNVDLALYGEEGGARKVLVCHLPPGNPSAKHNICVGERAVYAHLNIVGRTHNVESYLGPCQE